VKRLASSLLVLAVVLGGCRAIDLPPTTWGSLEVWNRTEIPITLVSETGIRLPVAACDRARVDRIDLEAVQIRADDGYIMSFGRSQSGEHRLVFTVAFARGDMARDANAPVPGPLPPCDGVPPIQEGV
jgi:hypothetical protein